MEGGFDFIEIKLWKERVASLGVFDANEVTGEFFQ